MSISGVTRGAAPRVGMGLLAVGLALGVAIYVQRPAMQPESVVAPQAGPLEQTAKVPAGVVSKVVPPFAYTLAGRGSAADGSPMIFLARDRNLYTLLVGGVVDERWRIDAVEADALRVTYLPVGVQQRVSFASIQPELAAVREASTPLMENGSATREVVVSAKDQRQLQALMVNPPPGVRIRIDDGKPANTNAQPVRSVPAAAVLPPPGVQMRADGSFAPPPAAHN